MMTSNVLARFRAANIEPAAASIYETIRQQDEELDASDIEGKAALAQDRRNLTTDLTEFEDEDIGSSPESARRRATSDASPSGRRSKKSHAARQIARGLSLVEVEDPDDDVPASLLIEGDMDAQVQEGDVPLPPRPSSLSPNIDQQSQLRWEQARAAQRIHPATSTSATPRRPRPSTGLTALTLVDARERAMWRWINTENLDNHLHYVYFYYLNNGFWSIILKRILALATMAFMVGFSLFLTQCIDYHHVKGSTRLSEILVKQCTKNMGFLPNFLLWMITFFWIWKLFTYVVDIPKLNSMHEFYVHLLNISEDEIQSISWQEIVARLMGLRDSHPNIIDANTKTRKDKHQQNKQRMDAHDIANRLMRKQNYMVAMINKDILDMTIPLPGLRKHQLFTSVMEWNLDYCIMRYVFNDKGQVSPTFLKDFHRQRLKEGLERRFYFAAAMNFFAAPFVIVYTLLENFFQNFNEYQKNPAQIGSRQYNVLAQWKFREFNELYHLFQRRLNMSDPFATRYINQFPKDKTVQTARFVTFVSGAIVSVLGLATVLDQENFLSFEITSGRTTIFYLGVFGSIWAVARGLVPDENAVYDSSYSMEEVIDFTHYRPAHWEGRLHTVEVKKEFERLYQMQIFIFAEEVLSMIFTPFVLWFSLPKCSDQIIDFFREFTVHVDGVGYVCSFAEFNFKKPGNTAPPNANTRVSEGAAAGLTDDYFATKDQKLEQSYWGFINDYARNPKTDIRFNYKDSTANLKRRQFNMPPPFPGLLSPQVQAEHGDRTGSLAGVVTVTGQDSRYFSPTRRAINFGNLPVRGTTGSPFQSILLDPHHQPSSTSGFIDAGKGPKSPQALRPYHVTSSSSAAGKRRAGKTAMMRSRIVPVQESTISESPADDLHTGPILSEERNGGPTADDADISKSKLKEATGSWKYPEEPASDDGASDDDDEDIEAVTGENAGVLGLIKQFQRARGEGVGLGGTGV